MAYVTTRAIALRCTDYSETSQVVALATPDMGQVHALAKGSRRPGKGARKCAWEVLTHYECVLSLRTRGKLHLAAEWSMTETYPCLRGDLRLFWTAFYGAEVVLRCTSETEEDGGAYVCLRRLLRCLEGGGAPGVSLFVFLAEMLRVAGCVPVADRCAHCGGKLRGRTRFSAAAGGGVCGECGLSDPGAFSISRGALAVLRALTARPAPPAALRVTAGQTSEIQRAFNEQIQYHLGTPLRSARFLALS